jgi:hypothetical protein
MKKISIAVFAFLLIGCSPGVYRVHSVYQFKPELEVNVSGISPDSNEIKSICETPLQCREDYEFKLNIKIDSLMTFRIIGKSTKQYKNSINIYPGERLYLNPNDNTLRSFQVIDSLNESRKTILITLEQMEKTKGMIFSITQTGHNKYLYYKLLINPIESTKYYSKEERPVEPRSCYMKYWPFLVKHVIIYDIKTEE